LNEHAHSVGGVAHAHLRTSPTQSLGAGFGLYFQAPGVLVGGVCEDFAGECQSPATNFYEKRFWREMSAEFFVFLGSLVAHTRLIFESEVFPFYKMIQ